MFTLITLPYTSLAPVISDQTLAFHHGKHLQAYVDNLNKLISGTEFEAKGTTLFGSGWVWLQANAEGELSIAQYANADNPVVHGFKPLLTFDVWEHAYYLDYQNRRAAHLSALWSIINWSEIESRYSRA